MAMIFKTFMAVSIIYNFECSTHAHFNIGVVDFVEGLIEKRGVKFQHFSKSDEKVLFFFDMCKTGNEKKCRFPNMVDLLETGY